MKVETLQSDVLIIGGGTAGLWAAIHLSKLRPDLKSIIVEKADIRRSGCLAAGVNALNAYIGEGPKPSDYADYALMDAHGIARYDLLLSMSERLNSVTEALERLGLVILKDSQGKYITRGWRNVKINGENIKPLLAETVSKLQNVTVLNHINIVNYLIDEGAVIGASGFGVRERIAYTFTAKATLIATGGASGIYRPNHPAGSRHQMWYPPFNTGAGYAMGIRAGAEMTTFEMRFIALRCKDTIAPTGTLAQGVKAQQINSRGELFQSKYGNTTSERVFAVTSENLEGRGPCYLKTECITKEQESDLINAYFNMAPAQSLKWLETGLTPSLANVEIAGTEPYIVGGHTASGYWIDNHRRTTLPNLWAVGDVAGGCPQKYVTGALAETEIAVESILESIDNIIKPTAHTADLDELEHFFDNESSFSVDDLETAMQSVMDEYAGGLSQNYRFNTHQLEIAKTHLNRLERLSDTLHADDMYDLLKICELRERLTVAKVLVEHLKARKETRWAGFYQHLDYPQSNEEYNCFVNSRLVNDEVEIVYRRLKDDFD